MGGAASLLKKKEKVEDGEPPPENEDGEERENEDSNAKPGRFKTGFANLKKRATVVANKALAKAGLAEEEDASPDDEEDETPQKKTPIARAGSEVCA